jgi:hypothetical protein
VRSKEAIKARSAALAVTPMVLAANHRKEIVELAARADCRRCTIGTVVEAVA